MMESSMQVIPNLGAEIVERLSQHYSDLDSEHALDFFFYLPSAEHAESIADRLRGAGFEAALRACDESTRWLCVATKQTIPDEEGLNYYGEWFRILAREYEGVFDGWESNVLQY
jgi:uncharacterized protein (DUF924 family)